MNPERILCVSPNWVGDSIFMLPAVDALRRRFPQASVDLVAKPSIALLHGDAGRFRKTHAPPAAGRAGRLLAHWRLRAEAYDLAVVFPDSFSSALGARFSGAKLRAGRAGEGRSPLLSAGLRLPPKTRRTHAVDEYLALAEACGATALGPDRIPRLLPSQEGQEECRRLFREHTLEAGRLVGLCPTAAYGPAKRWPREYWIALAGKLLRSDVRVALFCAAHELGEVLALARDAGGLPVLAPDLAGITACLSACDAVVANDSGPLHIAAAVGTPCLGLYGSSDPRWTAPRAEQCEVLSMGLSCSPCFARTCPLKHFDCLRTLSVERVLDACFRLLKPVAA
jgi:heptosyltransferase-2